MDANDLLSRLTREAAIIAAENALEQHANRRRPREPLPTSVHNGWVILNLYAMATVAITFAFAYHLFNLGALDNSQRIFWLVASGIGTVTSALCLWGAFTHRIDWDIGSVRFRDLFRDRTLAWGDIIAVAKKSYPPRIRIEFRDGDAFAIYETMHNSRYFMDQIQSRLTPDAPGKSKRGGQRQRARKNRK